MALKSHQCEISGRVAHTDSADLFNVITYPVEKIHPGIIATSYFVKFV